MKNSDIILLLASAMHAAIGKRSCAYVPIVCALADGNGRTQADIARAIKRENEGIHDLIDHARVAGWIRADGRVKTRSERCGAIYTITPEGTKIVKAIERNMGMLLKQAP